MGLRTSTTQALWASLGHYSCWSTWALADIGRASSAHRGITIVGQAGGTATLCYAHLPYAHLPSRGGCCESLIRRRAAAGAAIVGV